MITYHDAFAKANHYLDDADLPVVITLHGRFSQGWYFCFEAREFLETGDEAARLAGNAPFIIDIDNDGCDEVMAGFCMIDNNGSAEETLRRILQIWEERS